MGSFFTNTSFIPTGNIQTTVSSAMELIGYQAAEDGTELMLLSNGKWCTIHTLYVDENQLHDALSKHAGTVLTISCCDSDFMTLTLTRKGRTETVCVGEPYEDEELETQLTPEHWQPIVGDIDAFRSVLHGDYVFAEESLDALGKLFGFDAAQINVRPDRLPENPPDGMISLYYEKTNPSELDQLRSTLLKSISQVETENKTLPSDLSSALSKLTSILFSDTDA